MSENKGRDDEGGSEKKVGSSKAEEERVRSGFPWVIHKARVTQKGSLQLCFLTKDGRNKNPRLTNMQSLERQKNKSLRVSRVKSPFHYRSYRTMSKATNVARPSGQKSVRVSSQTAKNSTVSTVPSGHSDFGFTLG